MAILIARNIISRPKRYHKSSIKDLRTISKENIQGFLKMMISIKPAKDSNLEK